VSSEEQAREGYSLQAQADAIKRYASENEIELLDVFSDRESGRSIERPQFQEMMALLSSEGSVSFLIVHKIDRLGRSLESHVQVRATLRKHGVRLVSVTESLEDSASGLLVENIMAALADFYAENLSNEVKKGQTAKVAQGGWCVRAPRGYLNVRDNGRGVIVPDTETAPLIVHAFTLYSSGDYSLTELRREMNARGLSVARSALADILKNPVYVGKIRWKGAVVEGTHEAIVSLPVFNRVQDVLAEHDLGGERAWKHDHYLKGTLYCGSCGAKLSYMLAKNQTYPYFYCLGKHTKRTKCAEPYTPADDIEHEVAALYEGIAFPTELRERIECELETEIARSEGERADATRFLAKRLSDLARKREKLLAAYYADALPLAMFKREQRAIDEGVAEVEQRMESGTAHMSQTRELVDVATRLLDDCAKSYAAASPDVRRKWNRALFARVNVSDRSVQTSEYREPFQTLLRGSEVVRALQPSSLT
jgi:site-specific DNA recombinase